jgi:hypothetical protein
MHSYRTPKPDPKPQRTKLNSKDYSELRKELFKRAKGRCENPKCPKGRPYLPLLDRDGQFDIFTCGHVSHIKSKGAGGDDSMENCLYECYTCNCLIRNWGENG